MAWLRIDDRVRTHPKIAQAGPAAAWLWFCGVCYCREHLTDGFIPKAILPGLALNLTQPEKHAKSLVAVNLWHVADGGYQVHDFLDWNPSRAEVNAQRDDEKKRKRKERGQDELSGERPAGQIQDSGVSPSGVRELSSHGRACAPARALSSLGSGSENSGSENIEPTRSNTRVFERQKLNRMNHAGVVPLIDTQFGEFVSRVSPEFPDRPAAYAAVLAWMNREDDAAVARGKAIPGDPFKWWQGRFDAWKRDDGATSARVFRCTHQHPPPNDCRDDAACTTRYLNAQRGDTVAS